MRYSLLLFAARHRILTVNESSAVRSWLASLKSESTFLNNHSDDYSLSFSRSSGPGGQNVNKLNTKATLRLDLASARSWLPDHVVSNLRASPFYAGSSDSLVFSSMKHRTQTANSDDCLEKLHQIIISAAKEGLQGETSRDQKQHVKGLIRAEKARTKTQKSRKSTVKQGRGKVALN
ncbi:MAG: hypothetical protein CYPHOPRED_005527 [Cyphobasidiales sp. Tagirdzhanova-0007]|nr:MAG: hypothetical protein CYPHOPRED_005527 [Cyphobasidiales sp. Tagirdzhanova-0007]